MKLDAFNVVLYTFLVSLASAWIPEPWLAGRLPSGQRLVLASKRTSVGESQTPVAEGQTEKKDFFFRWRNGGKEMEDQVKLLERTDTEEAGGTSPELIGAGAFAASTTAIAGFSAANSLDIRYVFHLFGTILKFFLPLADIVGVPCSKLFSAAEIIGMAQEAFEDPSAALDQVRLILKTLTCID